MVKYSKYVSPSGSKSRTVGIYPNNYSSRLTQILEMAEILKADFPNGITESLHTVVYGGISKKGVTGVEMTISGTDAIPADYIETKLELLLGGNG